MQLGLLLIFGIGSEVTIAALVSVSGSLLIEDNKCYNINACPGGKLTDIKHDSLRVDGIWIGFSLVDIVDEKNTVEFLESICPIGSDIRVDFDKRFGGLNAEMFCEGHSLNDELVHDGYAVTNKADCRNSEFAVRYWATC